MSTAGGEISLHAIFTRHRNFTAAQKKPDVVFVTLSLPDEHGYCSFGVSCDYTKPAAEVEGAKVVAAVNPNMPRTLGDSFIHVSDIDVIVEDDTPIPELALPEIGDVEMAIGKHIASMVNDGDCLQLESEQFRMRCLNSLIIRKIWAFIQK